MKVIDRRMIMPNGRREGDIFHQKWCEDRQKFCEALHKQTKESIDSKLNGFELWLQRLDKRMWLIVIAWFGNIITIAIAIVTILFRVEIKEKLLSYHNLITEKAIAWINSLSSLVA